MTAKILNGDCLELMKDIPDESIDLLFTDLPYGEVKEKWDIKIDMEQFWSQVNRICKINAPMFFCCSARFGSSLIQSNLKNFRYDMVWKKSGSVGFLNARKMPLRIHELVYVFYRKLPLYDISSHKNKFDISSHKNKFDISSHKDKYVNEDGTVDEDLMKTDIYGMSRSHYKLRDKVRQNGVLWEPRLPVSVLEIKSEKGKHSTQKPVELMRWCLKYYSKEGDVVLDPTMGSGSTGIACKEMNRKFIGIEKDEKIYNDAKIRLGL